jgi:predicted protein tyrosine phosphatase
MGLEILGYHEAKSREGQFEYVISINDASTEYSWRVIGTKATLFLNFNDVWYDEQGRMTIWGGPSSFTLPEEEAKRTQVPGKDILDAVDAFIEQNPNFISKEAKTMVHCWAGVSRSSSIVLYIMLKTGYSLDNALKILSLARPQARPNLVLVGHMEEKLGIKIVDTLRSRLDYTRH